MRTGSKAERGEGDQAWRRRSSGSSAAIKPRLKPIAIWSNSVSRSSRPTIRKTTNRSKSCRRNWENWDQNWVPRIDGREDIDPKSEEGQEIESTLVALDKLCTR